MSYEDYWYGDPLMVRAYYKADKLRQQRMNEEAGLNGAYVYKALDASVGNAFRKKGTKMEEYPDKPVGLVSQAGETRTKQEREEAEALFAQAYMMQMVTAGKNWGSKEVRL